jgi:hypothetical protein
MTRSALDRGLALPGVHWWAFFALVVRVGVAFSSDRITYPDEVFQYLEQAHRLVFGYGYVPWEYRFGTRSWMLPYSISWLLSLCQLVGWDKPGLYIPAIEVFFCAASVTLVYSGHAAARGLAGETAGRLAAAFAAGWYELVYVAQKATPEVLATYGLIAAMACLLGNLRPRQLVWAGALAALTVALRVQYLPAVLVLAAYALGRCSRRQVALALAGSSAVIAAAGYVDYLTWGEMFASYYNNYLFNVVYGVSASFGAQPSSYYIMALLAGSAGLFAVAAVAGLTQIRKTWLVLAVLASVLIPHTLLAHKEYRFVFAAIPLFLMVAAVGLGAVRTPRPALPWCALVVVGAVSAAGLSQRLPGQHTVVGGRDLDVPLMAEDEILEAYLWLAEEPGLVALYNASVPWYWTGGYYYLHRDVPIYRHEHEASLDGLRRYVSHVICGRDHGDIPGFAVVVQLKTLDIRRQTNPPSSYRQLNVDTRTVTQPGVDDQYRPTVKRRL